MTGLYGSSNGLLVATNRRIIFLDKGWTSFKMEDFSYDKVTTIESQTGLFFGELTIYASGNKEQIKQVPKDFQVRPFADFVRNKLETFKHSGGQPSATPPEQTTQGPPTSIVEELKQLAALRDDGVLTEEEFAALKTRLIAR